MRIVKLLSVLAVLLVIGTVAVAEGGQVLLNAAGATFPYPIYSKWFDQYHQAHANVQINYQSIGSGGGIRQLLDKTVDFGASDGPMSDDQLKTASVPILHFPTVLGAAIPSYNVAGVQGDLNFTPEALSGIFLWKITKWNDPAIVSANLGGKGNEGVSALIQQTPGSLGYIELIYAIQNHLPYGKVKNSSGAFVKADLASVSAAAAATAKFMPDDFRVSITNPEGKAAYPIASFTWLLIPAKFTDAAKRDVVKDFLKWMMTDGQQTCEALSYAKLPKEVVAKEMKAIAQIQ